MAAWVDLARSQYAQMEVELPTIFVFSIPFALLVSGSMTLHHVIWWKTRSWTPRFWFWCVPLSAIGSELLQIHQYIPGTFDQIDLAAICMTATLAAGLTRAHSFIETSKERPFIEN
ncbi:hypothetical protein OAG01_01545 [bacterium]|nr:hypothetical protein [bacterium]MDB4633106.1 hypothetical protein [bacterium]